MSLKYCQRLGILSELGLLELALNILILLIQGRIMRIQQPDAPNSPPKFASPLEMAIFNFEQQAKQHHKLKVKDINNLSVTESANFQKKLESDLEHLQRERDRLTLLASLQAQVESYREKNLKAPPTQLLEEEHHPTEKLAEHLRAVGEPKPSDRHDAHHIIPGKGRWRQKPLITARLNLHLHGVGINDPFNGVWLPRNKADRGHWATPKAPAHKEIHRFNYETWIVSKFANSTLPKSAFLANLRGVKQVLKYGGFPDKIVAPKDANWSG